MKSGMLAAEAAADALLAGREGGDELSAYEEGFKNSWLYDELYKSRNFGAAIHKWGAIKGGAFNFIDQNIFGGKIPSRCTTQSRTTRASPAAESKKIEYPKPDGKLSFDKLSSVFLSNTNHEEDQPVHLKLTDPSIPIDKNLPLYDEPAQRYCPAGVYEVVSNDDGSKRFQINAQNCVHCKTCDIRTRPRTSPGSRRKVPVGRTTPTCNEKAPREPFYAVETGIPRRYSVRPMGKTHRRSTRRASSRRPHHPARPDPPADRTRCDEPAPRDWRARECTAMVPESAGRG